MVQGFNIFALRTFLLLCLLLLFNVKIFSHVESNLSFGFEYNFYLENTNAITMNNTHSLNISINNTTSVYIIKNIGFFVYTDILFPFPIRFGLFDYDIYDFSMRINVIAGPGFILPIGNRLILYSGIGCNLLGIIINHTEKSDYRGDVRYERLSLNTGLGCRLGMEFYLIKNLFLNLGNIFTFDFSNYTSFASKFGDFSGFAHNYAMFEIRPYLSIGFYLKRRNTI